MEVNFAEFRDRLLKRHALELEILKRAETLAQELVLGHPGEVWPGKEREAASEERRKNSTPAPGAKIRKIPGTKKPRVGVAQQRPTDKGGAMSFTDMVRDCVAELTGEFKAADVAAVMEKTYPGEMGTRSPSALGAPLKSIAIGGDLKRTVKGKRNTVFQNLPGRKSGGGDYEEQRRKLLGDIKVPRDAASGEPL